MTSMIMLPSSSCRAGQAPSAPPTPLAPARPRPGPKSPCSCRTEPCPDHSSPRYDYDARRLSPSSRCHIISTATNPLNLEPKIRRTSVRVQTLSPLQFPPWLEQFTKNCAYFVHKFIIHLFIQIYFRQCG